MFCPWLFENNECHFYRPKLTKKGYEYPACSKNRVIECIKHRVMFPEEIEVYQKLLNPKEV